MRLVWKGLMTALLALTLCLPAYAKKVPIGMLANPQGKVEYTKNGKKWKKVRRNKFMYKGYMVRLGADSSVQFINQNTGGSIALTANSEAKVTPEGLEAVKGELGAKETNDLLSGMSKKFAKTQKYTTVRRSAKKEGIQLKLGHHVVTPDFPEIGWESVGSTYSYRLHIGQKDKKTKKWADTEVLEVPAVADDLVRVQVQPPKKHMRYYVEVLDGSKVVFTTKQRHFKRMTKKKLQKFDSQSKKIQEMDSSGFLYAGVLKDNGLLLPAMESYERFFAESADDEDINELRPFLVEVYSRLGLSLRKAKLLREYKTNL